MMLPLIGSVTMIVLGVSLAFLFARDVTRADDPPPFGVLSATLIYLGGALLVGAILELIIG